jgi:hypothetical protein
LNLENLYRPGGQFGPKNQAAYDAKLNTLAATITAAKPGRTHPEHGMAEQLLPLISTFRLVRRPESVMEWLNASRGGPVLLRELGIRAQNEPITHASG